MRGYIGTTADAIPSLLPGAHVVLLSKSYGEAIKARQIGLELRDTLLIYETLDSMRMAFLFRVPMAEPTVAANVLKYGTGALNIDGCRVAGTKPATTRGAGGQNGAYSPLSAQGRILDDGLGRWPPNTIFTHLPECGDTCTENCPVAALDEQSGILTTNGQIQPFNGGIGYGLSASFATHQPRPTESGGASRFFHALNTQAALIDWFRTLLGGQDILIAPELSA